MSTNRIWMLFIVPVVAMGLSGLWHEASWGFLVWGVWHGVGLSVYLYWNYNKKNYEWIVRVSQSKTFTALSILAVYVYFTIGLLWFN
jgi:alginate O-acetyltransferase complex protein AlgI